MRKVLTVLFALCAVAFSMHAQEQELEKLYNLRIHLADGTYKVFHVERIDSVTFYEAPNYSDLAFDIKISDIFSNGVTTKVSCNRPDVLYYSDVFEKAYLNDHTPEQLAQEQLEYMWEDWEERGEEYMDKFGMTSFADFFYPGSYVDTYTYDYLKPERDYIVMAFGVDLDLMEIVGTPVYQEFSTTAPEPSDNIISFEVRNDSLFINTTNNDPYFWNPFTAAEIADWGAKTAEEAWELSVADFGDAIYYYLYQGSVKGKIKSFFFQSPGTYTLVAAGWNGGRTTDFFSLEITVTPEQSGLGGYGVSAKRVPANRDSAEQQMFRGSKKLPLEKR